MVDSVEQYILHKKATDPRFALREESRLAQEHLIYTKYLAAQQKLATKRKINRIVRFLAHKVIRVRVIVSACNNIM